MIKTSECAMCGGTGLDNPGPAVQVPCPNCISDEEFDKLSGKKERIKDIVKNNRQEDAIAIICAEELAVSFSEAKRLYYLINMER